MMISLVQSPANLFQSPAPVAKASSVVPSTAGVRPEQLLRALVVAKQADRPILEMAGERFQATSAKPLQVGQVLDLRILQTGGRIEALVMNNQLQDRLAKRLPLLTRPFDWYGLLDRLQRPAASVSLRPVQTQQLQQLQQLLAPAGGSTARLGQQLEQVAAQLRPFVAMSGKPVVAPLASGQSAAGMMFPATAGDDPLPAAALIKEGQAPVLPTAAKGGEAEARALEALFGKLRQQVTLLVQQGERETSRNWQRDTSLLLSQVREQMDRPALQTMPQAIRLADLQQTLQQLQQHPQTPPHIAREAAQLMLQLSQLAAQISHLSDAQRAQLLFVEETSRGAVGPAAVKGGEAEAKALEALFGKLRQQVTLLVQQGERETSRNWQRDTSLLLSQVREQMDRPALQTMPQAIRLADWQQTLQQLQQHPQTPPHIAKEAAQLILQVTQLAAFSEVSSKESGLAPEVRQALVSLQQVVQEAKALQVAPGGATEEALVEGAKPLPPALLGRIEGVMQQLHQLAQREGVPTALQDAIATITTQLHQLATAPSVPARGEALGLLSQFFGLHLERELLYDKQKTALNNLKHSLLTLQQAAGEDVREPLQRIELFQFAKARFAELHMQFLPLPFSDLEEGFMLAQRQDAEQGQEREAGESYQVSLSLRLSALGNMRVDMQFDRRQGVIINLACENQTKADFIKTHGEELKSALSEVRLRDLSYSTDAAHPVQLLRQRLLPQQTSLLDTRA